ncbi:MAG TPA: glycosyltransferase family 4 protein [Candidatus Limnocylindrales bacterium]|jgi:glycosyltransferase involved in cell wall biosynthesis|nr:glycosyltransferase family 4 protein [Candidatus Limnocylindrales bacterium]
MRVTHVITRLIVGGAQENTVASVFGLRQKPGVEVSLISGPSQGPEGSLEKMFTNETGLLRIEPSLVRPVHPLKDYVALKHLEYIFKELRPDVVHTHSGKAGILGRLAAAHARVPIIVHTVHGPSFGAFQGFLPNLIFRSAERHAARVTTHFVVVADAMKRQYLAAGIARPDQYTRIFSGFVLEPFLAARNDLSLRAQFGLKPDDFVVGKIARLFKLKGHDDLFAVAPALIRQCGRMKFLLVGDGPWRGRFEQKVRDLGLENHFVFAGLVPPERVPPLVGIMDVLVHLSTREGLARALPQALAAARPVVSYNCDGAGEVCLDNQTGFLLEPGDVSALENRLVRLAREPSLGRRLGETGQALVRERFSVQQMVDQLHSLYSELLERNSRKSTQPAAAV